MDRGLLDARRLQKIAQGSARGLRAAIAVGMLALTTRCEPAKSGGLVVLVESDLALPKDVDHIHLVATEAGRVLFEQDAAVGAGALLLPAPFRLSSPGKALPVVVRALGSKAGAPRIERSAIVQIPDDRFARLRLQLNFLCLGLVGPDGSSSCGADQTCEQGSCTSSYVGPERLTFDLPSAGGAAGGGGGFGPDGLPTSCFDVSACYAGASPVEVEPATCTFTLPPGAASDRINVGLKLDLGQDGVCAGRACWIALPAGGAGWITDGMRVALPPGVCRERPGAAPAVVAISSACAPLITGTPPCGDWTSVDRRVDMAITADPDAIAGGAPRDRVGSSCDGFAEQACADCGKRTRSCNAGVWSEWSECTTAGECSPAAAMSCGSGGIQVCSSECAWGECSGQTCSGPASRACGNCGTQRRTCANGAWTDWSACSEEGACMPGTMQSCGTSSVQACGGDCKWGACGDAACAGAPSEACGNCGTRTRSCDPRTRTWSGWSECTGQGACMPDTTQTCGSGGTQVCRGDCSWDAQCGGQSCTGQSTQLCGNCGVQTRRCDPDTGTWSEWSVCAGAGECAPATLRACGAGGMQACGTDCHWIEGCTGQVCAGAAERTCGSCGMQTRSCMGDTGQWSEWSACTGQGSCAPGTTRSCGAGGVQTCGPNCEWEPGCGGQMCAGEATQACGNCGMRTRTCNAAKGTWSEWSACSGEGACPPGDTRICGAGGTQTCGPACRWGTSCSGQTCSGAATQACGSCGMQSRTCNTDTAQWSAWSACTGQGSCTVGETRRCGTSSSGTQTCGRNCEWELACTGQTCAGEATQRCGSCGMQTRSCNSSTGDWSAWSTCIGQGECDPGMTRTCATGASQTCSPSCSWGSCDCSGGLTSCLGGCVDINSDPANCGGCGRPCGAGQVCRSGSCQCSDPSRTSCFGSCVDLANDSSNCGSCSVPCSAGLVCRNGLCGCPAGLSTCDQGCVDLNSDQNNCGACDNPCGMSRVCSGGFCVCPGGLTLCGNECVNTQSDRNNCGGCGFGCTPDETCGFGFCST